MGIGLKVEAAMDKLLDGFVSSKSAAVCAAIVPLMVTGVTIYIIVMGWAVMRGEASDSLHTVIWKAFRIALICGLALGAGAYQSNVVEGLNGIEGAFTSTMAGVSSIGGLVDNMSAPFEALFTKLMAMGLTHTVPDLGLISAGIIVALAEACLFVVGLGLYLLAKVALALVLAVGPAFIFCALFPATQKYTESWLGQALTYVLLKVLVAACIAMLTDFASQFAAHVEATSETSAILKDVVALFLVSCSLAVVMLNVNTIAAALAGGAVLSGVGREILRKFLDLINSDGKDQEKDQGGELNKGRDRQPSEEQGGSEPLYQRHVMENLQRRQSA